MKELEINKIEIEKLELSEIARLMDNVCKEYFINIVNWEDYPHKPEVSFNMAYYNGGLVTKYKVAKEYVRAVETKPNGNVWDDSCLEFFCSFNQHAYYNFETNCIGTQLIGWREVGSETEHATSSIISEVKRFSTLGNEPIESDKELKNYELLVVIPKEAFFKDNIELLKGFSFKANFYKCGDKTKQPHFLSWNKIESEKPNFHLPEFFAKVVLL